MQDKTSITISLNLIIKSSFSLATSRKCIRLSRSFVFSSLRCSICFSNNEEISVGVYPVSKVVDPTGAGDVFGGGFVSGLAEGLSIYDSMRRGTALASFCIEDFGVTRLVNINPNELKERVSSIK